jgi:hypothetical protein
LCPVRRSFAKAENWWTFRDRSLMYSPARVVELVDTQDLKSCEQ